MPKTDLNPRGSWCRGLILILALAMASPVWAQPGGMGKGGMGGLMQGGGMGGPMDGGGGPGGRRPPGRQAPPRFDLKQATTITGKVESLGSYRQGSWRSLPGMAVQGLVLKTGQGNIEVYLGPPSYVSQQKFILQKGDTLKVHGFKVLREDKPAFFAAKVTKPDQTLNLLDEHGSPLWKQPQAGGPGADRAGRGSRDPSRVDGGMMGGGMMGGGSLGRGR